MGNSQTTATGTNHAGQIVGNYINYPGDLTLSLAVAALIHRRFAVEPGGSYQ